MAKQSVWDYSTSPASNTDIDGTDATGATGLVKSGDNYTRSMMSHMKGFALDLGSANTVGGTADVITVTLAAAPSALVDGMRFTFNASAANTGATTLNVTPAGGSAFGAKKLMKWEAGSEAELSANEIPAANALIEVIYDSARDSANGAFMKIGSSVAAATTSAAGIVELATPTEAFQASSATLAVTPAGLANLYSLALSNAIEIADLKGSRLNMAGGIADAYDSETDVDTATSTNESYDAVNDLYSPTATIANTRALDFESSSSQALSRAWGAGAGTSRRIGTFSWWGKRESTGASQMLLELNAGSGYLRVSFSSANKIQIDDWNGGSYNGRMLTTATYTDTSAYHRIVFAWDVTLATATDRWRLYYDGVEVTTFDTDTAPTQNVDLDYSSGAATCGIGYISASPSAYYDGLMDEVAFIDGQQLTPSSFEGSNLPIDLSGLTFGTKGFWLRFEDTGSLGTDSSGNGNTWTLVNTPVTSTDAPLVSASTNNMTLVSNAFTATAVPTVARIATFIDPQESITINTDFITSVSRDGGSTFTPVTLALVSNPVGTVEQYEGTVSLAAQPSGSSMVYQHETDGKDIDVTGTVFQWG